MINCRISKGSNHHKSDQFEHSPHQLPLQQQPLQEKKPQTTMDKAIVKGLGDRLYERRKTAALELEQQIRQYIKNEDFQAIQLIIEQLSREFAYAVHQPNARNGGLISLASTAVGIGGKHLPMFLESIIHPILACFGDQDDTVRFYACESLYNVTKVAMGEILPYFNEVFDVLCKLADDPDSSVKNAMGLLDRLIKDIVCEMGATYVSVISRNPSQDYQRATQAVFKDEKSGVTYQLMKAQDGNAFSLQRFMPLLMERIQSIAPYTRVFLITWLLLLNSVPDLDMVSYLPCFLGELVECLNDSHNDVKNLTKTALDSFLDEIQRISHIQQSVEEQRRLNESLNAKEIEKIHQDQADTASNATSVDDSQFNTVIHKPDLKAAMQNEEQATGTVTATADSTLHTGEVYIPGQDAFIDYPKIIQILLSHIDDSEERIQLVVLTWLSSLLEIAPTSFIEYLPKLLSVLLLTMAKESTRFNLKEKSQKLNQELLTFVSELKPEDEKQLNYKSTINTLTLHLLNENEITKVTALDWLKMLHKKSRESVLEHDGIFTTLLKALSDPSEEVIYGDLQLISEISFESDDDTFQSFIVNLLDLFKNDQKLLEKRGNFILRRLCLSLDPVRVYQTLATVLKKETNSVFVGIIIQILNNNLITAPELATLRKRLRSLDQKNGANFELFSTIFKAWCHNAPATLTLCLLSQSYELAYSVLQIFVDFEITVNVLVQIDILVQLLESPVFTRVRLQLLEPEKYPYLYKCLYGILMLLPQSTAFVTLKNRLSSVSVLNSFPTTSQTSNGNSNSNSNDPSSSQQLSKTNSSKSLLNSESSAPTSAAATASEILTRRNFKYAELLARFRTVQQDHEDSLNLINTNSLKKNISGAAGGAASSSSGSAYSKYHPVQQQQQQQRSGLTSAIQSDQEYNNANRASHTASQYVNSKGSNFVYNSSNGNVVQTSSSRDRDRDRISGVDHAAAGQQEHQSSSDFASGLVRKVSVVQDVLDLIGLGQSVDIFKVFLGDFERLGSQVWNVLVDQLVGLDVFLQDVLFQEGLEWLDTVSQVAGVERNRDPLQWDGGETSFQINWLRLDDRLLGDLVNDFVQVFLHLFKRQLFSQLPNVDLLQLDKVQDVGQGVQGSQVTGSNVFDSTWVDSNHTVVGSPQVVSWNGNLHGHTSVEHNFNQGFNGHDFSQGGQRGVLTQGVTGKDTVGWDQTLGSQVFERGLFHQSQSWLGELSSRDQTTWVSESEGGGGVGDFLEDLLGDNLTVNNGFESHLGVVGSDGSTLLTTKVDSQLFWVVLDNVDDGEAVSLQEVFVGSVPDLLGNVGLGVEVHTHTLFLGTLPCEDKSGGWLFDLSFTR
ncbi:hypothetical protein WICPIJ_008529 [Wickerhamomyces pijperi]|uniref:Vacuolar protein 14 C-terminal Fig4-binding domain-containing protein n=1 Tax=Wickerhamomyces pijperi TaxID=599730 RepID=A0A9P8PY83_WICPI|nr:hypothetical protein WICPIJ_008529 [Wickerhamomyces pijperi]